MGAADLGLEQRSIHTIRMLSIDAIEQANSGHPGLPMGAAPMAYVLWQNHLRHSPRNPQWVNRDRFVLSAGHGSMLLYSLLHLTGYDVSLDDVRQFRQWGSRTPGHPEVGVTAGVEATTGPLGQGFANAVGMAIAERHLAACFNRPGHEIIDHFTYVLSSDGDLMEGVCAEAASLAGHLRLSKLVVLFDANSVSLDGPTALSFTEDIGARFASYGWQVIEVADGDTDMEAIDAALTEARADTQRPSLLMVRTTIGFGAPTKAGKAAAHGSPLGPKEVAGVRLAYEWPSQEAFHVPADVGQHLAGAVARGMELERDWQSRFAAYAEEHPEAARALQSMLDESLPEGWDAALPTFDLGAQVETRAASGKAINAIAAHYGGLIGLDADLSSSTKAYIEGGGDFVGDSGIGRNVRCGVREHAMGSIANGIAYHGGLRPFTSTFFVFADYMRPPVRLAAMNHLRPIYIWTHDSIAVGEDGPTHQPVEQLASLRAMPNLVVLRPADANETVAAWRVALEHQSGPVALVLTRQKVPVVVDASTAREGVTRGAYVIAEASGGTPRVVLLATGSEVSLAVAARQRLEEEGVPTRVVSMPSWELFEAQDAAYRERVLPAALTQRVAIEAASSFGWQRYVGSQGAILGIDRFGASAPGEINQERFGFTVDNVARVARAVIGIG